MKRFAPAFLALAIIAVLFGAPAVTHAAGLTALCWADKYELAQGDSATVSCTGFSPLTYVNVYYVEPGGTAAAFIDIKSDANGNVAFGWGNGVKNSYSFALGTYKIVVQQLGLAKEVKIVGEVEIKNVGTGDSVSGAYLTADKTTIDRSSEGITLTGWGFAPGEIVSAWTLLPSPCGSFTLHYVDGKNGGTFENDPVYGDLGTFGIFDIKTDSSGAFVITGHYFSEDCEGTYRVAARGNTSGLGAYVDFNVSGSAVSTNAWLVPSKTSVGAFNDTIQFWAYGFGANETLNCWTTSPDGRAVAFGASGSFDQIKMGADGSGAISLTTGAYIISPDDPLFFGVKVFPLMSEGAIGVWKLTCNGLASGSKAIAEYKVHGYELTP